MKRGQTARRIGWVDAIGVDRRQAAWRRQLIEAAGSEDSQQRLWAAVLGDAMQALQGVHRSSRAGRRRRFDESPEALWREACAWVLSREHEPLGTFESVCAALQLDTEAVRRDLCAIATAFPLRAAKVAASA